MNPPSGCEAMPVLAGDDEGLHHLRRDEISVELHQLGKPEVVTSVVCVGVWTSPYILVMPQQL